MDEVDTGKTFKQRESIYREILPGQGSPVHSSSTGFMSFEPYAGARPAGPLTRRFFRAAHNLQRTFSCRHTFSGTQQPLSIARYTPCRSAFAHTCRSPFHDRAGQGATATPLNVDRLYMLTARSQGDMTQQKPHPMQGSELSIVSTYALSLWPVNPPLPSADISLRSGLCPWRICRAGQRKSCALSGNRPCAGVTSTGGEGESLLSEGGNAVNTTDARMIRIIDEHCNLRFP